VKRVSAILAQALFFTAVFTFGGFVRAGGPLGVTGQASPQQGTPYTWDPTAMPIHYTVDSGPLSVDPLGKVVVTNATGLARLSTMLQTWQSVPTAAISYSYSGPISAPGLPPNPDIQTVADYNAVLTSCNNGTQSPVIFDAGGTIRSGLGIDPGVIGFAGPCKIDPASGHILSALVLLNGEFQDGISDQTTSNYEITADEFDQAITHELGHFSGLDHSQINVEVLTQSALNCKPDDVAGLPLMFPFLYCQTRVSLGLPKLAPDDAAWISKLYPGSSYSASYGTISGFVYFSDGITQVQGMNVIARLVDDPSTSQNESTTTAVSVVSGYLFTGNPGQPFTGDNTSGSPYGSRNPAVIGYYEIPVPPGIWTVQVENINSAFLGGSSVGPLGLPYMVYANEYWHHYESAYDDVTQKDPITVGAGQNVGGINIILNGTPPRFDQFEDGQIYGPWYLLHELWARLSEGFPKSLG
jgi:hypothetical protein